jgi:hypothetical protein
MLSLLNTTFTNAVRKGFSLVSSLLNKLKQRVAADGGTFENEACTKAILNDLNNKELLSKATLLTTATAYNFRKIYSIKPSGLGDELVTNGDFATNLSGWALQNVDASNTITWEPGGARVISVGVNISLRQLGILEVGETYKLTCDLAITTGRLALDSSTAGSTIQMVEGFNEITFTASSTNLIVKRFTGNDNCLIDNISVKEVGAGDFEFNRGSLGTRVNSAGYIDSTLANAQPRIDYLNGCGSILLEPARTNVQTRSEEFDNSVWSKNRSSITPNQITSPSGLLNADEFVGVSGSTSYIYDGISVASGSVYTISVFAKYIDISEFKIVNFQQNGEATFNTQYGLVVANSGTYTEPKIENYGNGWYRCSAKFTATATGSVNYGFFLNNAIGKSVGIWGAQVELGSYPTSYIPTTTAAVTRNAETAFNSGNAAIFNNTKGVLMAEISALNNDGLKRSISINDGSSFNRFILRFGVNDNTIEVVSASNNSALLLSSVTVPSTLTSNKVAIKWDSNNYVFYVNGIIETTKNDLIIPLVLNNLDFNDGNVGLNPFYGNTKQVQYYDSVLTDSELEALTSWASFLDMAQGQSYTIE